MGSLAAESGVGSGWFVISMAGNLTPSPEIHPLSMGWKLQSYQIASQMA